MGPILLIQSFIKIYVIPMNVKISSLLIILILTSPFTNGQTGSIENFKIEGNYYEERRLSVDVFLNEEGKYSISKVLPPHYSIPQIDVLGNGNLILLHSLEGVVEIHDFRGEIIFRDEYYKLAPYHGQRLNYKKWSGGFLIVLSEANKNRALKMLFDGSPSAEIQLVEGMISGVELSADGELLIYSTVEWINDDLLTSTNVMSLTNNRSFTAAKHFENGYFNTDLSRFIGWEKRKVFCLDLLKEEIVWEWLVENEQMISDAIIQGSDSYILVSNKPRLIDKKWIYDNIRIIGKDGSGIEKHSFNYDFEASDIKLKARDKNSILLLDGREISINKN